MGAIPIAPACCSTSGRRPVSAWPASRLRLAARRAALLAEKIVAAMQQPFELDGITVRISASIGLAFYRDEDIPPAVLLQRADVLLYQAKQDGRNTYRAGATVV